MKKIILILSIFAFLPLFAFAEAGGSLDESLNSILKSQNASQTSEIKCDKVSDQQFEELGDRVMGVMHPNEQEHELMDQMMGGEGSASLKAAHIYMGKQYLGCTSGTSGYGMMGGSGMMGVGGGMMGGNGNFYNNMMSGSSWIWLGFIYQFLFLSLIILAIAALIKWLSLQNKR